MTTPHESFADQSLKPGELLLKTLLLSKTVSLSHPAVIFICETWLNNKIANSELQLNDYLIFRSDRNSTEDKNPHGDTLIAMQSALNCRPMVLDNVDSCDNVENKCKQEQFFFYSI